MDITLRKLMGWKNWRYIRNYVDGKNLPSAAFPKGLLPARGFWLDSYAIHCALYTPWTTWLDPFGAFLLGGATGTLAGTLAGLMLYDETLGDPMLATWGIGERYPAIQFGYNIGTFFKEQVYVYLSALRASITASLIVPDIFSDVVQRSRFKRIYVKHGEIVRFQKVGNDKIISLGLEGEFPDNIDIPNTSIKIKKYDGTEIKYKVQDIRSNWDIVIEQDDASEETSGNISVSEPAAGDFYEFDKTWTIEDPLLMSGMWFGQESEYLNTTENSPDNVYVTSHNRPYESGIQFTGAYIWKKTEVTETEATETEDIILPAVGSNMDDVEGYEWVWIPFENNQPGMEIYDDIYQGTNRYKLSEEVIDEVTGAVGYRIVQRTLGQQSDINAWFNANPSYIRLEISKGGRSYRHNWQPSCLQHSYIKQSGNYYKILAHLDANTIDVNCNPAFAVSSENNAEQMVSNPVSLFKEFEIFNQYAWMIVEHFMENNTNGMFGGLANGVENITIAVNAESPGTIKQNTTYNFPYLLDYNENRLNSFYVRFKTDYNGGGNGPIKMWKKFNKWRVVDASGHEYSINGDNINIGNNNYYPYNISVRLQNTTRNFTNEEVYIAFDETFKNIGGSRFRGLLNLSITEGMTTGGSPVLCLDGDWFSPPIKVDLPQNTSIGVCEGYMFGLGVLLDQVQSNIGAAMVVSTPGAFLGLSSFFHNGRDEDCVFYRDIRSNNLTIRRGTLDFREMPRKQEISIGYPQAVETVSAGETIILNTEYDRTKMIQMEVPFSEPSSSDNATVITFGLGDPNNYYGFYISGDGEMDFQALRRLGYLPGDVDIDFFTNGSYFISPIYLYCQKVGINELKDQILDIGVGTDEGPLYILDENVNNVKISYINKNQTLEDIGLYDALRLPDGEILILYNQTVGAFKANENPNNGLEESKVWNNNNCVFMISSFDDGFSWGCPLADLLSWENNSNYQYALMLLNGVEYLSSIYDNINNQIKILIRGYIDSGRDFLGYYALNVSTLIDNIVFCENEEDEKIPFLYRPPAIPYLRDDNWSFIPSQDVVNIGQVETDETLDITDKFIRIIGSLSTYSRIDYSGDFGMPILHKLSDGTLMVLFDGVEGIRMLYSINDGTTWKISRAILARNAKAPVFIAKEFLAYISTDGIEIKLISENDLFSAMEMIDSGEGNIENFIEIEQSRLDAIPTHLIGSGPVDIHRVSGYKTKQGTIKIFYYNSEGFMNCLETTDLMRWKVANNF